MSGVDEKLPLNTNQYYDTKSIKLFFLDNLSRCEALFESNLCVMANMHVKEPLTLMISAYGWLLLT